jgi:hypothetical protein
VAFLYDEMVSDATFRGSKTGLLAMNSDASTGHGSSWHAKKH